MKSGIEIGYPRWRRLDTAGREGWLSDEPVGAHFSPSWTAFQSDRGRRFSAIVDDGDRYTGTAPALAVNRLYGVTTFELG